MTPYQINQLIEETLGSFSDEVEPEAATEVQEVPDELSNTSARGCTPEFLSLIRGAKAKMESRAKADWAARKELMLDVWRREDREKYERKQAKLGKTVRRNRRHTHVIPNHPETYDDRLKREHRDRQRTNRGKDADTVRPYNDLSILTDTERAEYKRKLNRLHKQASRRRQKPAAVPVDNELTDIDRILTSFEATHGGLMHDRQWDIEHIIETILAARPNPQD